MVSPNWVSILVSQVAILPYLLAYLCGIILAVAFWRRHPTVSLLTLLGFGLLLGNTLLGTLMNVWLMSRSGASGVSEGVRIFAVINAFRGITGAGAYALLMAAIFGWRTPDSAK